MADAHEDRDKVLLEKEPEREQQNADLSVGAAMEVGSDALEIVAEIAECVTSIFE